MVTRDRGGAFLFGATAAAGTFIPEQLGPERRAIATTAREFAVRDVRPRREALERHQWDVARRLLRQAGELGLIGAEAPEAFGGLGLDKVTASVIAQALARGGASFSIGFGVQSGIGLAPLLYFGTPEQKRRYLPLLTSGEWVAAYSLTEPDAGSDALSARTIARRSPDGRHFLLSGTKQWTTNGGFADLFVVYAKVDGEHFTSFLVERAFPGIRSGPEERKMGYAGSSTTQVLLDEARVPVENVLHEVGKGHQVAFNTLNVGRFKLAPACLGSSIALLETATSYARDRRQFGRPIASFPLVSRKLADMATRIYALESVTYRLAALLDGAAGSLDLAGDTRAAAPAALGEHAVECSIVKVLATETLDFVVDEAVQIHGGNGYMQEYEVERAYRDSRVNRIFEGTNEINRLLIPTMLFRRAARGVFPDLDATQRRYTALLTTPPPAFTGPLDRETWLLDAVRARFWRVAELLTERHGAALEEEQETLAVLGDLAIAAAAMDSVLARATRVLADRGPERAALDLDLARTAVWDAFRWAAGRAAEAFTYLGAGTEEQAIPAPVDRIAAGRRIAARVLAAGGWPLAW